MPLMQVNVEGTHPAEAELRAVEAALKHLPPTAPVVICIHGFKFSPDLPEHDPHNHILALDPESDCPKALSWPRGLGFGSDAPEEGLCIALGWPARGTLWQAYRQAQATGEALARIIWRMDRPVHLFAHSMGARVALSALPHVTEGAVGRVVLMAAAEFRSTAQVAMDTEAGRSAEVINMCSRENDLFDLMFELALSSDHASSRSLSAGLGRDLRNWCDIQIDDATTRAAMKRLGFDIPAADKRICHWSPYLRSGVFDFYRQALRTPQALPLGLLTQLIPQDHHPRFSRLIPQRPARPALSFTRKAPL